MKKIATLLFLAVSSYAIAQPKVTSLSPASGHTGAAVTVAGTGFNTTPANNIVYFGATRATVTSASSTSLTVQVPVGATYMPVSVNNTATSLTGSSAYPFLPTFDNSAYPAGATAFEPKVDFAMATATYPYQILVKDIDGDGKADLLVLTYTDISVYHNTSTSGAISTGSFAPPVFYPLPATSGGWYVVSQMAIGDVDGDGAPDLVFGPFSADSVYVMRNISTAGTINFSAAVPFATGGGPSIDCIALADIDGDGKTDVVVGNNAGSMSVLLNSSPPGSITLGSFAVPFIISVSATHTIINFAIGDLDGDGKVDVAYTSGDSTISVFRNTSTPGSISLASQVTFGSGLAAFTNSMIMCDIDGDGKPDLAVTNGMNNTISIFRNTAITGSIDASSFDAPVIFESAFEASSIVAGDFDGDGKPDLAVTANPGPYGSHSYNLDVAIYLYHNNAIPGAINQASLSAIAYPLGHDYLPCIVAGDLDGDGKPDIITANIDDSTISVLRNAPVAPVTISTVSPNVAAPGAVVTITGGNFNTTLSNNIVFFGATQAVVTAASGSSLTVTVPAGATYDAVMVENTVTRRSAFSKLPFLPTFDGSGVVPGPILFDTAVNFADPAGSSNRNIVIADFDGDGKADVAAATDKGFAIYRNTASAGSITSGSFAAAIDYTLTATSSSTVAAGDINGDGKPDLLVPTFFPGIVSGLLVYRNTSTPGAVTFAAPVFYPQLGFPSYFNIRDMNGDGKPDVILGDGDNVEADIALNTSEGNIDSSTLTPSCYFWSLPAGAAYGVFALAIGDIDGDGLPDAVESTGDTIWVYRNVLTGFSPPTYLIAGNFVYGLTLTDVDGDGKMDIAAASSTDNTLSVFRNTATPGIIDSNSFASRVIFATGNGPQSVAAGDLNGDGKPELVVLNNTDQSVSIFRNTATAGFINSSSLVANVDSSVGNIAIFMVVGDIDGDGKADIVTACQGYAGGAVPGGIAVLTNKTSSPTSTTGIISPAAAAPNISILPNPNKGIFRVNGATGTGRDEAITLQVTDLVGQVIYARKTMAVNGVINEQVVLNNSLANGMYLLNVTTATWNHLFHFVVEK